MLPRQIERPQPARGGAGRASSKQDQNSTPETAGTGHGRRSSGGRRFSEDGTGDGRQASHRRVYRTTGVAGSAPRGYNPRPRPPRGPKTSSGRYNTRPLSTGLRPSGYRQTSG